MNALLLIMIPIAPLLAVLVLLIWGRWLARGAGYIAVLGIVVSLAALWVLSGAESSVQTNWLQTGALTITVGLHLDGLSSFMAWLVAIIGLLITVYSLEFIAQGTVRFFALFSFFLGAMLTLVLANSFLLLFAAWEGVGVASYLLIGFWYHEDAARQAAQKAFLLTRLGDFGLLLGWLLVLHMVGTTDMGTFLSAVQTETTARTGLTLLALLFFTGAIGKSAQLPLTAWLPDAMAGPTPVSALIHSATMVAAGVYLVLRLFPLFEATPVSLDVVFWVGGITALFAALVATMQNDLKRLLAWSTISQIGEMMFALGLGGSLAAIFHLATHAVFKSTLFLAAGAIDHCAGSRDLRQLGGLARAMPVTAFVFVSAGLALAGFPPFSGFWSEETILADAVKTSIGPGVLVVILIFLAGVYISRAGMAVFASWPDAPVPSCADPGKLMTLSMIVLALGALGVGWALKGYLEQSLTFAPSPTLGWVWRGVAILASLIGLVFGAWRVRKNGPVPALGSFPGSFARALDSATRAPARLALTFASGLHNIEWGLEATARRLGRDTLALADGDNRIEQGLDRTAHILSIGTFQLANTSGVAEDQGVSYALDRFASSVGRAGSRLRTLQSGKLYLYTLGLFIWVLLTSVVVGLWAWLG